MKSFYRFIRATFTGGILFLLPMVLLFIIFGKAFEILHKISAPIAEKLPDQIFGFDGSMLLAILLLIVVCFFSGLLFKTNLAKKGISKLEDNVLVLIPGYSLIKSITAGAIGEDVDNAMKPILIKDGESWGLGFLVEEGENMSTVFIPEAPKHDSGEIKIIPTVYIQKLDVSTTKFIQSFKTFGKGAIHWMK